MLSVCLQKFSILLQLRLWFKCRDQGTLDPGAPHSSQQKINSLKRGGVKGEIINWNHSLWVLLSDFISQRIYVDITLKYQMHFTKLLAWIPFKCTSNWNTIQLILYWHFRALWPVPHCSIFDQHFLFKLLFAIRSDSCFVFTAGWMPNADTLPGDNTWLLPFCSEPAIYFPSHMHNGTKQ